MVYFVPGHTLSKAASIIPNNDKHTAHTCGFSCIFNSRQHPERHPHTAGLYLFSVKKCRRRSCVRLAWGTVGLADWNKRCLIGSCGFQSSPPTVDQLLGVNSKQLFGTVSCHHQKAHLCKCWQTQREVTGSGTNIPDRYNQCDGDKTCRRAFQRPWYYHHFLGMAVLGASVTRHLGLLLSSTPFPVAWNAVHSCLDHVHSFAVWTTQHVVRSVLRIISWGSEMTMVCCGPAVCWCMRKEGTSVVVIWMTGYSCWNILFHSSKYRKPLFLYAQLLLLLPGQLQCVV